MTDEPRPPMQSDDRPDDAGRDAAIAAALEVPALDETTRRRLVRAAADAADEPPGGAAPRSVNRLGAAIGVAAVLLIGAVVGAVVVTRPDDPQTPTAARAPNTSPTTAAGGAAPAPQSAEEGSATDQDAAAAVPALPQELGDLGAFEGALGLRQAIETAFRNAGAERSAATSEAVPCRTADPAIYGLVRVTAAGEADRDGAAVTVLVGPSPEGQDVAVVIDPARGCELVQRVTL
jgi:hypothetical protein